MLMTLRQARRVQDMTQAEMAKKLGMHVQTYRKIEKDPGEATINQARRVAQIIGISYDEIFFGQNSS